MEELLLCEPDGLCHLGRAGPIAMDDIEGLRRILKENRTIAMVGLSWRYFAAKKLGRNQESQR